MFANCSTFFTLKCVYVFVWQDNRKFADHFYVDDSCFDERAGGPIFVEMGGEGPVRGAACGAIHKQFKALAVSVEHRFYGKSIPFNNRNVSMLKYLNVQQNLADTAEIINFIQKNRHVVKLYCFL